MRIDADVFRSKFPGYDGSNSNDFQRGAARLVDITLDHVLKSGYSFILDGTFALERAQQNIERALKRGYDVTVYYIYQDPYIAWEFTRAREIVEGRFVPKERFINSYFKARENIIRAKEKFDKEIEVNIVFKDYQNNIYGIIKNEINIKSALPNEYTREELEDKLND
jgi:predicted ABC-type ATPase